MFHETQDTHTDLRQWHGECLNFRILRRRLVDDPPDPWDDHPSMAESTAASPSIPSARSTLGLAAAAAAAAPAADISDAVRRKSDSNLAGLGGAVDDEEAAPGVAAAREGTYLAFSDPASRVFVFELHQVRTMMMQKQATAEYLCQVRHRTVFYIYNLLRSNAEKLAALLTQPSSLVLHSLT